jgi:hypothetical protein
LTRFDVPGAGAVAGSGEGFFPLVINVWGQILGKANNALAWLHLHPLTILGDVQRNIFIAIFGTH